MAQTPGSAQTVQGGNISSLERTLTDFRARMVGGGTRSNLFECEINFPELALGPLTVDAAELSRNTRFLIKAANLPASTLGVIDVPFRGRNLKIAGDRTFDPWTITVINDTDFSIRNAFERWMNLINKHQDAAGKINPSDYQQDAFIYQLGRANHNNDGNKSDNIPVLKTYKFHGVFPSSVSAIDVSYDSSDTIEEFTVDLQVQWWDTYPGNTTNSMLGTTEDVNEKPGNTGVGAV